MSQIIKDAITETMTNIVPENVSRLWYLEYIFKYKFGNRLPQGAIFDRLRMIENPKVWKEFEQELYAEISDFNHRKKVSPFLVSQYALLTLSKTHELCDFKTKCIFEVIKKIEGDVCLGKENLIKHNVKFSKKGILSEYKHHHVPLLPNSYLSMLAKKDSNLNLINLEALLNSISFPDGKLDLDMNHLEGAISSRGADKGGRLTGYWLITKSINGKDFYLGIFPHSNGRADDIWIKSQLKESERLLNLAIKRA